MVTREQLADILQNVNVSEVARRSGVVEKTIYRLRHQKNAPSLDTVQAILRAVAEIEREAHASAPASIERFGPQPLFDRRRSDRAHPIDPKEG